MTNLHPQTDDRSWCSKSDAVMVYTSKPTWAKALSLIVHCGALRPRAPDQRNPAGSPGTPPAREAATDWNAADHAFV